MAPSLRFLLVAGVVTAAAVVAGVVALGQSDSDPPEPEPVFTTTPLAEYDATSAVVARAAFCDRIDDRQVAAALDVEAAPDVQAWSSGDQVDLGDGTTDVAHEYGCGYATTDVGEARAWVFASPVGVEQAERMVRIAQKARNCTTADGPAFGAPTLAMTCTKDGTSRASYRGLFGDAWLTCEVVRPPGATWDVVDRAGRWCVGVLLAAAPDPN